MIQNPARNSFDSGNGPSVTTALTFFLVQRTRPAWFGAVLSQDLILRRRQLSLPLGVRLLGLRCHIRTVTLQPAGPKSHDGRDPDVLRANLPVAADHDADPASLNVNFRLAGLPFASQPAAA